MNRFITEQENTEEINEMLTSSDSLRCAVAFWGKSAFDLLEDSEQEVKIICNLESGGTNPTEIRKLLKKENIQVKSQHNLHAKVYLSDSQAIVGSSNVSANGLSFEDEEMKGYIEASILTTDSNIMESIADWFEKKWSSARKIDEGLLNYVEERWKSRRKHRLDERAPGRKKTSLIEAMRETPYKFKDRDIYLAMYRQYWSEEAKNKFDEVQNEIQYKVDSSSHSQYVNTSDEINPEIKTSILLANILTFYENWSKNPLNSQLINIHIGPNWGTECYGIDRTLHVPCNIDFKYDNGLDGTITLCHKMGSVIELEKLKYSFNKGTFAKLIKHPTIEELWENGEPTSEDGRTGRILSLYDAIKYLNFDNI